MGTLAGWGWLVGDTGWLGTGWLGTLATAVLHGVSRIARGGMAAGWLGTLATAVLHGVSRIARGGITGWLGTLHWLVGDTRDCRLHGVSRIARGVIPEFRVEAAPSALDPRPVPGTAPPPVRRTRRQSGYAVSSLVRVGCGHTQIERIRVRDFRAFREVDTRNVSRLAILVGANGTGKSTLFFVFGFLREVHVEAGGRTRDPEVPAVHPRQAVALSQFQ